MSAFDTLLVVADVFEASFVDDLAFEVKFLETMLLYDTFRWTSDCTLAVCGALAVMCLLVLTVFARSFVNTWLNMLGKVLTVLEVISRMILMAIAAHYCQ